MYDVTVVNIVCTEYCLYTVCDTVQGIVIHIVCSRNWICGYRLCVVNVVY